MVLPGVGHFGHCARELRRFGLDATVRTAGERGVLVPGEGKDAAPIRAVPFNGVLAGHRVITYYEPNKDS